MSQQNSCPPLEFFRSRFFYFQLLDSIIGFLGVLACLFAASIHLSYAPSAQPFYIYGAQKHLHLN